MSATAFDETRLRRICALLGMLNIPADGDEARVQDEIERQLRFVVDGAIHEAGLDRTPLMREVVLGDKDRIDFLIGGDIGIEVKLQTSLAQMTRQLHRYAAHERIGALVLLTTSARLKLLPHTLNGKPIRVVYLAARSF